MTLVIKNKLEKKITRASPVTREENDEDLLGCIGNNEVECQVFVVSDSQSLSVGRRSDQPESFCPRSTWFLSKQTGGRSSFGEKKEGFWRVGRSMDT